MDIVIYTNPYVLLEKRKPDHYCWWSMRKPPKNFKNGDKIWFAVRGEVMGYFICDYFDPEDPEKTIEFRSDSWVQIEGIYHWQFCKRFRKFKYRWWEWSGEEK